MTVIVTVQQSFLAVANAFTSCYFNTLQLGIAFLYLLKTFLYLLKMFSQGIEKQHWAGMGEAVSNTDFIYTVE